MSQERNVDWDKVRVFYKVAEAGSFTKAGDDMGLSQSAVSRQISSLEKDLKVVLFHRHARGLILTEQGEMLFRTAREITLKLDTAKIRLNDSRERPSGELKITSSVGLGSHWLTPRLTEFMDMYPEIKVEVILTNDELDLAMREADVAVRLRQPTQSDLIQRKLFTVHFHVYGSADYLKRYGTPQKLEDLDDHRLISFGGTQPSYLLEVHWLAQVGREGKEPRPYALVVNNITALRNAVTRGMGLAVLPDYLLDNGLPLTKVLTDVDMPSLEAYLVYPEEMRSVAKVQVFRDFLISNAQRWTY